MTSRTSCCKTILLKDITRFAPAWAGYTLCLLLGLVLMASGDVGFTLPSAMASCISFMALVNLCYGLVTAQLLFGDLCSSRLCYGLHTLPIRRGEWFRTHVISGMLFSLVPTAVMTAIALPMLALSTIGGAWQIGLWWFLGTNLSYGIFFALGSLCMVLSGSRVGALLIYGGLNFASLGAYLLVNSFYTPMFYGFILSEEPFFCLAPVSRMVSREYIDTDFRRVFLADGEKVISGTFSLTDAWCYLWICAVAAVLILLLALELYRRRDLERAGDTVAFPWMKQVFQVAAAVAGGILVHVAVAIFLGVEDTNPVYLFVGLGVGWFAGKMLLERSTRVFRPRNFLGLGAIVLVFLGSILLCRLDPLGWETWIPRQDQILSVRLSNGRYGDSREITDPEGIQAVRRIHAEALEYKLESYALRYQDQVVSSYPKDAQLQDVVRPVSVMLTYTLTDGREILRQYCIWPDTPGGKTARMYFSDFTVVTGLPGPEELPQGVYYVNFEGTQRALTPGERDEFFQALAADCAAGTMAQDTSYHLAFAFGEGDDAFRSYWLHVSIEQGEYRQLGFGLNIYADAEHVIAWLQENDFP